MIIKCRFKNCPKPPVWKFSYGFVGRVRTMYVCAGHKDNLDKRLALAAKTRQVNPEHWERV